MRKIKDYYDHRIDKEREFRVSDELKEKYGEMLELDKMPTSFKRALEKYKGKGL